MKRKVSGICLIVIFLVAGIVFMSSDTYSIADAEKSTMFASSYNSDALSEDSCPIYGISANTMGTEEDIALLVLLSNTPDNLYNEVRERADAQFSQIKELQDAIKNIYRRSSGFEASLFVQWQVKPLVNQVEELKQQKAAYTTQLLHESLDELQADAAEKIDSISGSEVMHRDVVLNSLIVMTSEENINEIIQLPEVLEVVEGVEGEPLVYNSAQALKIRDGFYSPNTLWEQGYYGEGIDIMGMDTGVYTNHPAFFGLSIKSQFFPGYAADCTVEDDYKQCGHGTLVAGIISSRDMIYKGMSYGIDTYYNAKFCSYYGFNQRVPLAYDWAALGGSGHNDAEIISLSWAFDADCEQANGLHAYSAYVDNTVDLYDVVWSIAAGNRNQNCGGGYIRDKPQTSYNGVSVAGVKVSNTPERDDDYYYGKSKYGPVFGADGTEERLKPDIMLPTYAYSSTKEGCPFEWFILGGTSGAAPHYSGLVADLMGAGVMDSKEVRALTFATAEDWDNSEDGGPATDGPDYYTGFGYADAWSAYSHIADTYSGKLHSAGKSISYMIKDVKSGDRVVLVYNKHGGVYDWKMSNLDIIIYDTSTKEIIYESTKQYENKEFYQFTDEDAGKNVIIKVIATHLADGLSYETYAISANTEMTRTVHVLDIEFEKGIPVKSSPPKTGWGW